MTHHDIDVAEVVAWLVEQRAESLWTIDGEDELAGRLSMPSTADDVAAALRAHGGRIRVYDPPGASNFAAGERLSRANLAKLAEVVDDSRAFQLAWLRDGTAGDRWMLIEDALAEEASSSDRRDLPEASQRIL